MQVCEIVKPLNAEVIVSGSTFADGEIAGVVVSDLMSDVLVVDDTGFLLVSSLASEQLIRTADIVGAVGVVLVNGKRAPPSMRELAESLDQTFLRTEHTSFHTCRVLASLLYPDGGEDER